MRISKRNGYSLQKAKLPVWLIVTYLLLFPGIITGGYIFYKIQSQQLQEQAESNLKSIAQLKVDQIVQWRAERMGDAYLLMENTRVNTSTELANHRMNLLSEFNAFKQHYNYKEISFTDPFGKILINTENRSTLLSSENLLALKSAFEKHEPVIADLHINTKQGNFPQMDIAVPLFNTMDGKARPLGAIILCIDARQYLYPLLQTWPIPEKTSETFIVRRQGDSVLYLNELRNRKNTTLAFSISLKNRNVPSVMAVLGKEGIYKGLDYRGKSVLAMLKHIPDSPWFMVAKIDTDEAFALIRYRSGFIFVLTLLLLILGLAVTTLFWKQGQKSHYKALYQIEFEKQILLKHFEYLVKYANDIILLANDKLQIIEINNRGLEEYRYTHDEIKNLSLFDLIAEVDKDHFHERLSELKESASYIREGLHKRKDGTAFPVEISGRYIEIDETHYYQGIIRNITERKQAEEALKKAHEELNIQYNELKAAEEELASSFEEIQSAEEELAIQNEELLTSKERAEESDRLKTAFLQNMSHEIRTPMNAIVGFSSLLKEYAHNPKKIIEFSDIITNRSSDLLSIINEVLEVSRIETGQIRVNAQECDINHLLDELYSFFKNYKTQTGKDNIALDYKKITNCESNIVTDMVKFKQVFINLIQNALKYTFEGKIIFGFEGMENGHLVFFVSDTGKGIPEDKFTKIFDRFMQIDPNPSSSKAGLGLGLSIVKGLVTLLGGKIWLTSKLNQGSIFYFTIPHKLASVKGNMNQPADNLMEVEYAWHDKTFLIVEDDTSNQEYFKHILENRASVIFSTTAKEAIDLILFGAKIDLILMDIRLPDMSGFEATRKIKSIKPFIPVIAQTAYAMENDRENSYAAGCDGYISKPIFSKELFTLISSYINS